MHLRADKYTHTTPKKLVNWNQNRLVARSFKGGFRVQALSVLSFSLLLHYRVTGILSAAAHLGTALVPHVVRQRQETSPGEYIGNDRSERTYHLRSTPRANECFALSGHYLYIIESRF